MKNLILVTAAALAMACASQLHAGDGAPVLYVNGTAAPGGDGSTWASAYDNLDAALAAAEALAVPVTQIWVAAGTYVPTQIADPKEPRSATFTLAGAVEVFGGFVGQETALTERDPAANVTIFSGDLNGDDLPDFGNRDDNASHVVTVDWPGGGRLDGFTIRGGAATNIDDGFGGGILINLSIHFPEPPFTLVGCTFIDNLARNGGGLRGSGFNAINCHFTRNHALSGGGGAGTDGPIGNDTRNFVNCIFINNTAVDGGGGLEGIYGGFNLYNCTVVGNSASGEFSTAGGVFVFGPGATLTVHNSIVWGNSAAGAATNEQEQFWVPNMRLGIEFTHSCIEDWAGTHAGSSMVETDPLFADPLGDDGVMWSGDETPALAALSPCVDAGDDAQLPADVADLDGNGDFAETLPIDFLGAARVHGMSVDIGAIEHHGEPKCIADIVAGDTFQPPGDGTVDGADLAYLLGAWGPLPAPRSIADFVTSETFQPPPDGAVDGADLAFLLGAWGDCE